MKLHSALLLPDNKHIEICNFCHGGITIFHHKLRSQVATVLVQCVYTSNTPLYPFRVETNGCDPCVCDDERTLVLCPDALDEMSETLYLESKQIVNIRPEAFNGLERTKILFLGSNPIETIPARAFSELKGLKTQTKENFIRENSPQLSTEKMGQCHTFHSRSRSLTLSPKPRTCHSVKHSC